MKIVKSGSDIKKVSDIDAVKLVNAGWKYCAKSEWKARKDKAEVVKEVKVEVVDVEADKKEKKQSKKNRKSWQKKAEDVV